MADYLEEYLKKFPQGEAPVAPSVPAAGGGNTPWWRQAADTARRWALPTSLAAGEVAPAAAPAAGGVWNALTKPISAWGAVKAAVPAVVGGAARVVSSPAALIPSAAGAAASFAAGGFNSVDDAVTGLNPAMFARAVGEGAARLTPEWLGGVDAKTQAAADFYGASDITGNIPATPAASTGARAATRMPPARLDVATTGAQRVQPSALAVATNPTDAASRSFRALTSRDFDEGVMPASGYGAIRRNGVVSSFAAPVSEADAAVLHPSQAGYNVVTAGRPAFPPSGGGAAIAAQEQYVEGQRQAVLNAAQQAAASGPAWSAGNRYKAALAAFSNSGGNDIIATNERAVTGRGANAATTAVARANALTASQDRQDKLLLALHGPEALKQMSEVELNQERLRAAKLIQEPGARAAATAGRAGPADRLEMVPPLSGSNDPTQVINLTRGTGVKVTPRAQATEANLQAEMKAMKLPNTAEGRARGKAAVEAKGYHTTGLQ